MIPKTEKENKNISNIWKYDQIAGSSTFCVTGEESMCVELTEKPDTYESGTIVKYKVNDTKELYFHIISDNGDTLTMQQRENTIYALDQTYTLGTTVFKDNAFTGCSINAANNLTCTKNTYTLSTRTTKVRMITIQELLSLGCTYSNQTCPVFTYNYLKDSLNNGATVNQTGGDYGNNYSYWTATANSTTSSYAWYVDSRSRVDGSFTATNAGARAVIVIEK